MKNWLKKTMNNNFLLKKAKELSPNIVWGWRFGVNEENYVLEYESDFIDSKIMEKLFSYVLKGTQSGIDYNSLVEEEWVVFDKKIWEKYEDNVLSVFPVVVLSNNRRIVSKRLDSLSVFKSDKGVKIKGVVKGLWVSGC